jgi:hypothetical protein
MNRENNTKKNGDTGQPAGNPWIVLFFRICWRGLEHQPAEECNADDDEEDQQYGRKHILCNKQVDGDIHVQAVVDKTDRERCNQKQDSTGNDTKDSGCDKPDGIRRVGLTRHDMIFIPYL